MDCGVEAFFCTLLHIGETESLGGMTFLRLLGRMLSDTSEFIRTLSPANMQK